MLKASLNRQPEKPVIDVHQSTQLTLATWQFNIIWTVFDRVDCKGQPEIYVCVLIASNISLAALKFNLLKFKNLS